MKQLLRQSRLSYLAKRRDGYLALACGALLVCLALAALCFSLARRERVILVPPNIAKSFWVGSHEVSAEYLAEMALFFCYLRLNMAPESAGHQRRLLLRYVDPRYFGALNNALVAEGDRIAQQRLSTVFYPVNVEADPKHFSAVVTGDLWSSVGAAPLPTRRVAYRLQYSYGQGRLLVSQFEEVGAHG